MAQTRFPCLGAPPAEGFYTSLVAEQGWPLQTFLPRGYEHNYAYPLLVFLHGHGSTEEETLKFAPRLSRRNYVCIAPRGPVTLGAKSNGQLIYSWGPEDQDDPLVEDYVLGAIRQTRREYHVHSERIYLCGFREGAALAYRLALLYPEKFAGVVSLNGAMPRRGCPLMRLAETRGMRVLIGHGIANPVVPLTLARQDHRLFFNAGLRVRMHTYPTTHRIHPEMMRDVDRWVQGNIDEDETSC